MQPAPATFLTKVASRTVPDERARVAAWAAGPPLAVEHDELVDGLLRKRINLDVSERVDGDSNLGEVLRAMGALGEGRLQAGAVAIGKVAVEVGGQERDGVAADQCSLTATPKPHHRSLPISLDSNSRNLARPRWSSTRWLPSLTPSSVATSPGSRP